MGKESSLTRLQKPEKAHPVDFRYELQQLDGIPATGRHNILLDSFKCLELFAKLFSMTVMAVTIPTVVG
jgi:hypothetical protein